MELTLSKLLEYEVNRAASQLKSFIKHRKAAARTTGSCDESNSVTDSSSSDSDSSFDEYAPIPVEFAPFFSYQGQPLPNRIRYRASGYKGSLNPLEKYAHLMKPCYVKLERLPIPGQELQEQENSLGPRGYRLNAEFKCHMCPQAFTFRHNLRRHLNTVHADQDPNGNNSNEPTICDQCGKTFSRLAQLNRHLACIHGTGTVRVETFICDICARPFYNKQHMTNHRLTHSGIKFPCKLCGKEFLSAPSLSCHKQTSHGNKTFPCEFCGRIFKLKYLLNDHRKIHTGEKSFKCPVLECGQTFRHRLTQRSHARVHTQDEPFKCTMCSASFKALSNLGTHKVIVHSLIPQANPRTGTYTE